MKNPLENLLFEKIYIIAIQHNVWRKEQTTDLCNVFILATSTVSSKVKLLLIGCLLVII